MENKIKTILFASLIAAMVLPFSSIQVADADVMNPHNLPKDVIPTNVEITINDEKQRLIDRVARIGEKLDRVSSETKKQRLTNQLESLKPFMLKHQLTPNFDFGEDVQEWEGKFNLPVINTKHSANGDWRVVHELKWGCNSWVYCTERWPEYVDLNDWSAITWNMPSLYMDGGHIKHYVENHSSHSQTETMNGWGTHTSGTSIISSDNYSETNFWLNHEVENETVLNYDGAYVGDRLFSTIRVT